MRRLRLCNGFVRGCSLLSRRTTARSCRCAALDCSTLVWSRGSRCRRLGLLSLSMFVILAGVSRSLLSRLRSTLHTRRLATALRNRRRSNSAWLSSRCLASVCLLRLLAVFPITRLWPPACVWILGSRSLLLLHFRRIILSLKQTSKATFCLEPGCGENSTADAFILEDEVWLEFEPSRTSLEDLGWLFFMGIFGE